METIHIDWEGPVSYQVACELNGPADYGIYQVYADHHVFGPGSLVYIGVAEARTFGVRLSEHELFDWCPDPAGVQLHIGRIVGPTTPDESRWAHQVCGVEALLIFAHSPPWNSQSIQRYNGAFRDGFHVINWRSRRALLPELTSVLWTSGGLCPPSHFSAYGNAPASDRLAGEHSMLDRGEQPTAELELAPDGPLRGPQVK